MQIELSLAFSSCELRQTNFSLVFRSLDEKSSAFAGCHSERSEESQKLCENLLSLSL
ncbi:MAG: hypothetical protein J6M21_02500 [Campylobacter sp.]|nr:hypothetical protein [Campylobacter sp.]